MFDVEEETVLKIFDESPKFRKDYIERKQAKSGDLFKLVCEHYHLNLIKEVYLMKLSVDTFNSQKRHKLKEQELILIKKLKIFESLHHHMSEVIHEVEEIDGYFTNYFEENYHETVDYNISYQIIFEFVENYFKEYEKRKTIK